MIINGHVLNKLPTEEETWEVFKQSDNNSCVGKAFVRSDKFHVVAGYKGVNYEVFEHTIDGSHHFKTDTERQYYLGLAVARIDRLTKWMEVKEAYESMYATQKPIEREFQEIINEQWHDFI